MGLKVGTVKLEEYNLDWKKMFNNEKNILLNIFGEIAISIEHIGSTSIEGISAKPIIDIAVGLKSLKDFQKVRNKFEKEPYSIKDNSETGEILVRKRDKDYTTHLIHVMEIEGDRYKNTILFRDYVKSHLETFKEYEKMKKDLAKKYANNRKMYTDSKNEFIQNILKKAYEEEKNKIL